VSCLGRVGKRDGYVIGVQANDGRIEDRAAVQRVVPGEGPEARQGGEEGRRHEEGQAQREVRQGQGRRGEEEGRREEEGAPRGVRSEERRVGKEENGGEEGGEKKKDGG